MPSIIKLLCVTAISALAAQAAAAEVDVNVRSPQTSTAPSGTRFELVQSTIAAKWTFRLDRFTGRVWLLVRTAEDNTAWEEMQVLERPAVSAPSRARFQLFTSGIAARHTFLIDGDTGRSWLIVTSKRKDKEGIEYEAALWQPFANQ